MAEIIEGEVIASETVRSGPAEDYTLHLACMFCRGEMDILPRDAYEMGGVIACDHCGAPGRLPDVIMRLLPEMRARAACGTLGAWLEANGERYGLLRLLRRLPETAGGGDGS